MEKFDEVPTHPLYVGVTVTVAVRLAIVLLAGAFHEAILPLPDPGIPTCWFEFTQEKLAGDGTDPNAAGLNACPGHAVKLAIGFITATGFT
jgi:hypothetical protein